MQSCRSHFSKLIRTYLLPFLWFKNILKPKKNIEIQNSHSKVLRHAYFQNIQLITAYQKHPILRWGRHTPLFQMDPTRIDCASLEEVWFLDYMGFYIFLPEHLFLNNKNLYHKKGLRKYRLIFTIFLRFFILPIESAAKGLSRITRTWKCLWEL